MRKSIFTVLVAALVTFSADAANTQTAIVRGAVVNNSSANGKAIMNIASSVGNAVGSNNNQTVIVNGSLTNIASGGTAAINLGSSVNYAGSNNQTVSVGSISNSASGGGKSEVNIGSVVKDGYY